MPGIPQLPVSTTQTGDREEVVLGVDTHKDFHVAAVITILGTLVGSKTFPTTAAGYQALLKWARAFGTVRRAGVECTGSYGAGLSRHLGSAGVQVLEVNQPDKATRRRRGKTDVLDAEAAARAVLSGLATAVAKSSDGPVEMLRMFKLAKASAMKSRSQAINQLKAVLVSAGPQLRDEIKGLSTPKLIRHCAALQVATILDTAAAAVFTLQLLARRINQLTEEITDLEAQLTAVLTVHRPALLEGYGVGPDTAAALLITAGDNPERLHSEASFAALCGSSPVEASSGKTQRHRLNRGGDRQGNCALHRIVLSRLRWDQRTRDYLDRRIADGKTRREAIRCLKRYVAREIFNLIKNTPPATTAAVA